MAVRGRSSTERGVAFVEFAIVLPLLLTLALGAVDLGRGLISYVELEQAAQEGALYGSFAPSDAAIVAARVRNSSTGLVPLSDATEVDVDVLCAPDVPAGKIGVRLSYTLDVLTPLVGPMLGGSIVLEARSVGTNFTEAVCDPTP
jgi:TadE-like protein